MTKALTTKHIAQLAGVSVGTVSHVLNGTAGVSDALRKRVEETVSMVNYEEGGYQAGSYLTRMGHKLIAAISGPSHIQTARDRMRVFAGRWLRRVFNCRRNM